MFRRSEFAVFAIAAAVSACSSGGTGREAMPAPSMEGGIESITAAELSEMMYAFAHDSMMGREAGTEGNFMATEYLAARLREIGVEPAGENGTYFQTIPLTATRVMSSSHLTVGGEELALGEDFLLLPAVNGIPAGEAGTLDATPVVYAGPITPNSPGIEPGEAAGKLVIYDAATGPEGERVFNLGFQALVQLRDAAGIVWANLDVAPDGLYQFLGGEVTELSDGPAAPEEGPVVMFMTPEAAATIMGAPLSELEPGAEGRPVTGTVGFEVGPTRFPARNVIGVVRGADPAVRGQYVAIGAHNDHVGTTETPLNHDSLRAYLAVVRPSGAEDEAREPEPEEAARIHAIRDSLRTVRPRARMDSVFNGADDDGSGSVAVLEMAEAFATGQRPRRSILFVWHTAEEAGLLGAQYFTENPTVPRDSIVAQLNIDMIGRGMEADADSGGMDYLQLLGSRRLSSELGDRVESVNTEGGFEFEFDYQYDAPGHPQQFYCRSDHAMYARFGIPIVFFSTGSHRDYHQLTDEPQYIDYEKLEQVTRFIYAVAEEVANLDHRLVVDQPVPDPNAPCEQ